MRVSLFMSFDVQTMSLSTANLLLVGPIKEYYKFSRSPKNKTGFMKGDIIHVVKFQ